MVLSASSPSSLSTTGSSYTYVYKQAISACIGITAMLIISKIDYRIYQKYYKLAYAISIIILLLVLVPGFGKEINGAKRWINLPIFGSAQPSEATKLGLILFFSVYLSNFLLIKTYMERFFKTNYIFYSSTNTNFIVGTNTF